MKYINDFDKGFLDNKNILVTGSTSGIGKELALGLSSYGANVILHGKNEDSLDKIYDEIIQKFNTNPIIVKCDLNDLDESKAQEFANAIQGSYERLDGIVNNAAIIGKMSTLADYDLSTWQKVININLTSTFLMSKFAIKKMLKNKSGKIVNITSVVGHTGNLGQANYTASKAGIVAMSKSLAIEYAKKNININCISPGFIKTAMTDKIDEKFKEVIVSKIPSARLGEPDDIANAVLFLSSNQSDYINGETLHVNGGMYMA